MGIPAAQVDHVFTPFWTTKSKGTGLGLALTHKIIDEHGGTIHLTSEVGQGPPSPSTSLPLRLTLSLLPRFHNVVPGFLGNDPGFGAASIALPVSILLHSPPNPLMSKSN